MNTERIGMERWITLCCLACLLASLASAASVAENEVFEGRGIEESGPASLLGDLRFVYRLYSDCDASPAGVSSCLKLKLATAVDRAVRKERMSVMEGVEFVKNGDTSDSGNPVTEEELDAALPRSLTERETALDGLLLDKVLAFFQTHTLQFKLAGVESFGRSLVGESARGKLKKMGPLLLLPLLFGATLIPIALGKLALLAGKALIIAKLALVLSAIIGLKKLLGGGGGGGGGGHDSSYQVVSGGGWNGGHYSRSLEAAVPLRRDAIPDAQPLVYRAHASRSL